MHCYVFSFIERVVPPELTNYIYINPTRVIEISIDTSHVFNTHALLSALFRQKECFDPYWHIIYIWFQKNYGDANMYQLCTKYTCTVICSFQVERFLPPILADCIYIYNQPGLLKFPQVLVMYLIHMHCYRLVLGRQSPATHTGFGSKRIMEMPIYRSHVLKTPVIVFFQAERFLPPILAFTYIYVYLVPTRITEIPIDTSHVLNTHTLFSALFRQKESCHPYWYIIYKDIWFQKNCIWKFIFYVLGIY